MKVPCTAGDSVPSHTPVRAQQKGMTVPRGATRILHRRQSAQARHVPTSYGTLPSALSSRHSSPIFLATSTMLMPGFSSAAKRISQDAAQACHMQVVATFGLLDSHGLA